VPLPKAHVSEHEKGHHSTIDLIGVTLTTDSGVSGSGYSFVVGSDGSRAVKEVLDTVLIPTVKGRRSHDVHALWAQWIRDTDRFGRGVVSLAISAVDTALWDLAAHERSLSLARHVGQVRTRIPAYASGQFSSDHPIDDMLRIAQGELDRGMRAIKLRVGLDLGTDLERIKQLRRLGRDDLRIMCDANERFDLPSAVRFARAAEPYDIFWLEEPLRARDVAAHQQLARSIGIPIAVGEHLQSTSEFLAFITAGAAQVLQPDVGQIAGTTEFLRIAGLVRDHGLSLAPHFLPELHIHLIAGMENAIALEQFPYADSFLVRGLAYEDGHALVPDGPGHGVEFTEAAWETMLVAGSRPVSV